MEEQHEQKGIYTGKWFSGLEQKMKGEGEEAREVDWDLDFILWTL